MKKNSEYYKKLKASALAILTAVSMSGCAKKVDCDVKVPHQHRYVNSEGFERYISSEYEEKSGYKRTDDYISYTLDNKKIVGFIEKNGLMRLNDNIELINLLAKNQNDYMEYRYSYTYMQPIPHYTKIGKVTTVTYTYVPVTRYSWTSDPNHGRLTGETRICHYKYYGYKIVVNEKGKYELIKSELVDDINTIINEYPYIKAKYYIVVNYDNNQVIDYEDGVEEEYSQEELEETGPTRELTK